VFGLFKKPPPPPAPKPTGVMAALSSLGMGPMEGVILVVMAIITHFARPSTLTPVGGMSTIQHVFYYGWVAALSTGLGALPLMFMGAVKDHWLGLSNAIAAGMMLSASFGLMEEGVSLDPDGSMILGYGIDHYTRVAVGFVLGMWSVPLPTLYAAGSGSVRTGGHPRCMSGACICPLRIRRKVDRVGCVSVCVCACVCVCVRACVCVCMYVCMYLYTLMCFYVWM